MLKKCKKWCVCLLTLALLTCQFGMVQAEENAFKDVLIVVDAGHNSNYNVGSVPGYNEGDWAYKQMMYDADAYRKAGFSVITTRGQHDNPGLVARGQMAVQNAAGYRDVVFISNHTNATPDGSQAATGVNACSSQYLSQKNTDLIYAMMTAVAQTMNQGTGNTYVRDEIFRKPLNSAGADWYGVIRGAVNGATSVEQAAQGPVQYAFILEHGFHTNPGECSFLMNDDNCKAIAAAKANALSQYFGNLYGISYTLQDVVVGTKIETVTPETTPAETVPETTAPEEVVPAPTESVKQETTVNTNKGNVVVRPEIEFNYWTGVVTVEDDGLNLRTEPDSFVDNIIAKLPNGTSILVTGEAVSEFGDAWFSVIVNGKKGFVNAKYVVPKYYDQRTFAATKDATVYALPTTEHGALGVCPSISVGDTVTVLNELKQTDGWWSIVKINGKQIGFLPNKSL